MRQRRIQRGALTLASAEVKFQIDTETHDPLDIGMFPKQRVFFSGFRVGVFVPLLYDKKRKCMECWNGSCMCKLVNFIELLV